jgi:hypothetical protein
MWMNEAEIQEAIEKFKSHPVLGKGARFLGAFRDEVNAHSDGWAYWQLPAEAAEKLMTFLHGHLFAGMGAYPRLPEPTEADLKRTITPIKAFYTRRGYAAGMEFPALESDRRKAGAAIEITVIVHVSIPVSLAFDKQPTQKEIVAAAIENLIAHPALRDAAQLASYTDKVNIV